MAGASAAGGSAAQTLGNLASKAWRPGGKAAKRGYRGGIAYHCWLLQCPSAPLATKAAWRGALRLSFWHPKTAARFSGSKSMALCAAGAAKQHAGGLQHSEINQAAKASCGVFRALARAIGIGTVTPGGENQARRRRQVPA